MATPSIEERRSAEFSNNVLGNLWPENTGRKLALALFRAGVQEAHSFGNTNWCTSVRVFGLRLNVGRLLFLGLEKDLFISFKEDALSLKGREWLQKLHCESKSFPSFPEIHAVRVPQEEIPNALEFLRDPFLEGIRQVAQISKGTPYMRAHSPGVLDLAFDGPNHPLPTAPIPSPGKEGAFETFFKRFLDEWWSTPKSKNHRATIGSMRAIAASNFKILSELPPKTPEFTQKTLLWCLPHFMTKGNKERGAWMPAAGAITKDIEDWFEGAKWIKHKDWPEVASRLFTFFSSCLENPGQLLLALQAFESGLPSKGFQCGMLSPLLNALRSDDFLVVNTKSIDVINRFKNTKLTRKLADMPEANRLGWEIIRDFAIEQEAEPEAGIFPCDVFDAFCHWMVAVYPKLEVPWYKIAPGEKADHWKECLENEFICLGWNRLGDITGLSESEFEAHLTAIAEDGDEIYKTGPNAGAWQVWKFRDIPVGATIVANRGMERVVGIGTVTGAYFFDETPDSPLPHRLPVHWFDTKTRVVMQPGWVSALKELDPETVHSIKNAPLETSGIPDELPPALPSLDENPIPDEEMPPSWWWLNCSPKIWKVTEQPVGTEQVYTATNAEGNKRRIFACFQAVQPGDKVIAYETTPTKRVVSLLEITKSLYPTPDGPDQFAFKILKHIPDGSTYLELTEDPNLKNCSPLKNNQGSLFPLSPGEAATILRDPTILLSQPTFQTEELEPDPVFFGGDSFIKDTVSRWRTRINLIVQGPPGVGKTFVARKLIRELMGGKDTSRERWIQFHQSYGYEEFVQGIRPQPSKHETNGNVQFKRMDGAFLEFCIKAQRQPGLPFVLVIDEINRGNLSKIFGELMVLIEPDKRDPKHSLRLAYQTEGEDFFVPNNVYILGMMNTADRSLAVVDYALRRRFMFRELKPAFDSSEFANHLDCVCTSPQLAKHILQAFQFLNNEIGKDEVSLGPGYCIGHSYFTPFDTNTPLTPSAYLDVLQDEIGPLLREYWFDQPSVFESRMKGLRFVGHS